MRNQTYICKSQNAKCKISKEKSVILHAKIFPAEILCYKKCFDSTKFFNNNWKGFEIKFFRVFQKHNNFLMNIILGQTPYIGVNYLISVSAFFEAFREVRGDFPFMVIQKRLQKFYL